ncbi:conserved hypothetical protein [Trichinella spiralis]|uniref:hypothetical protein n=1 Tax=Trichinella spiralis TaxID=6334 RepID=UPI0001EFD6EF|nr:conserved hypothetical protein [Trichinella spiralis]
MKKAAEAIKATIEILDHLQKEVSQLEESAKAKNTPSDNNPYPSTVEFCFIRSLLTETRNQCCLLNHFKGFSFFFHTFCITKLTILGSM